MGSFCFAWLNIGMNIAGGEFMAKAGISNEVKLEIAKLFNQGISKNEIANRLGISATTVTRWVTRIGGDGGKSNEDMKRISMENLSDKTIEDILEIRNNISSIIGKVSRELEDVPLEKIKSVIDTLLAAHNYLLETNEIEVKHEQSLKIEIVGGKRES